MPQIFVTSKHQFVPLLKAGIGDSCSHGMDGVTGHGLKAWVKDDLGMTSAMSFINIDDSCSNVGERLCPVAGYSQEVLPTEVSGL